MTKGIRNFITHHYRHFNAKTVVEAAQGYEDHLKKDGKMFITLAGAMSTAELGLSLAEMIRQDKVHGISCTGANLEEDVFNLVAHEHYQRIPHWRNLTPEEEVKLCDQGFNRVTDTCIPEDEAIRKIEKAILQEWTKADAKQETFAPYQYFWKILDHADVKKSFQIPPEHSWLLAAKEKNIPIFTPGWEDSTLGNIYAAAHIRGELKHLTTVEHGIGTMLRLAKWYKELTQKHSLGFFRIGGGIAGDFPICVVPMLNQDLEWDVPLWGYFCQIGDSTTSYGSYSGAFPSEKISWGKLGIDTPQFMIESDATIVAPLIFAYVLNQ